MQSKADKLASGELDAKKMQAASCVAACPSAHPLPPAYPPAAAAPRRQRRSTKAFGWSVRSAAHKNLRAAVAANGLQ